jgi:hypothetical protein
MLKSLDRTAAVSGPSGITSHSDPMMRLCSDRYFARDQAEDFPDNGSDHDSSPRIAIAHSPYILSLASEHTGFQN